MLRRNSLAIAIVLFFISTLVLGQEKRVAKVRLLDSLTAQPIEFATVYISKDGTTDKAKYSLTNSQGSATIQNLDAGEYVFTAEMMGYVAVKKKITIKGKSTDIGDVKMEPDVTTLDGAKISAVGNPIVVKKDTIEYNAASFKTTDNDMLEELLKKLPGVEVASDGTITANGETIKKITIDGRTFFLDDPQLATKNIPAKIIQKVKVVEKKSEQAQFTGIDDGEQETIIDLSIMPGMMKGWFGSLSGGGGLDLTNQSNDVRYQGSAMAGRFTDQSQVSFIGNGNNTNNRGFQDMAGEMMNAMRSTTGRGGGRMGGGMGGSGITTSWMGGVNANGYLLEDNAMKIGGNYLYSGSDKLVKENSSKKTFIDDTETLESLNEQVSNSFTQGHRAGAEMDYKITDKTSILFRPQFNYGYGKSVDSTLFSTSNSMLGKVNDGYSTSTGNNSSWSASGMLLLRQKIGEKQGRTISLNIDYSLSNNDMDGANKSVTRMYSSDMLKDSTVVDQEYTNKQDKYSIGGRLTYTEPLGKNYYIEASYRYRYTQNNTDKITYDYNYITDKYDILNEKYSNTYKNTFVNQNANLSISKQEKKFNAQIGVSLQPSMTKSVTRLFNENRDSVLQYSVFNISPSARFDYKFSDSRFLRLNYRGSTNQPSITQLQPVPDNSDPQHISLGNPKLQPEFTHDVWLDYRNTNMSSYSSFNTSFSFSYTKDNIVTASWYNDAGVQYSAPVNSTEGTYSGRWRIMYNTPIAKSKFSIMSFSLLSMSSYMTYSGTGEASTIDDIFKDLLVGRTTSLSASENLMFVYRDDYVETRLGGRASYSYAWYTIQQQQKSATWANSINAEVIANLPFGLGVKTDAQYNFYIGYDEGYGDPLFIWNAEISQLLFKKKATLRFKVYDILNQSKSISHVTKDNYVQDVQTNTLGRYCMLSLTFRFGNFNNMSKMRGNGGPHGPGGPR